MSALSVAFPEHHREFQASPASELYGRQPVYLLFLFIFFCFNIGSALAKTPAQFIVCRFFAGIGGSAPMTVGAGTR
jgi:MFS family permease